MKRLEELKNGYRPKTQSISFRDDNQGNRKTRCGSVSWTKQISTTTQGQIAKKLDQNHSSLTSSEWWSQPDHNKEITIKHIFLLLVTVFKADKIEPIGKEERIFEMKRNEYTNYKNMYVCT